MSNWSARAKAHFSQKPQESTDVTDETPILSVSSVPSRGLREKPQGVLSVSSVLSASLYENDPLTQRLLAAAMRACDHHADADGARDQMRQDCLATPDHLKADLLAHFIQTYGPGTGTANAPGEAAHG